MGEGGFIEKVVFGVPTLRLVRTAGASLATVLEEQVVMRAREHITGDKSLQ